MKQLIFILFAFCVISNTYASDECLHRPSCEELGYDHSVEECAGRDILPCPFDIKNTETVYCGDTLCDRLVAEKGFVKVKKKTTLTEFKNLLQNNAKIGLAEDITYNTELAISKNDIVLNGCGGHQLTAQSLSSYGKNLTIEDLKLEIASNFICGSTALYVGNGLTANKLEILQNSSGDKLYGIRIFGACNIENSNININGDSPTMMVGIWTKDACHIKNINLNLNNQNQYGNIAGIITVSNKTQIDNLNIESSPENVYSIIGFEKGRELPSDTILHQQPLYQGERNTKAIVEEFGNNGKAAYAAAQFYVGDKNGDFGQGKWYLPSLGEWMDFYGTDISQITSGYGASGAVGNTKNKINNALLLLKEKGVKAGQLMTGNFYWTSSEESRCYPWIFNASTGYREYSRNKSNSDSAVRAALALKSVFNGNGNEPQVGNVMYEDKTWEEAENYTGNKKPVGIIGYVSEDKKDVIILALDDLRFQSSGLDPENPHEGYWGCIWGTGRNDVNGIENLSEIRFITEIN